MKLSTRSRYGTRLLLDMAEHYQGGPTQLGVIARRLGIAVKYLEQIIIPLKREGLVKSARGYKGGYMLARRPEEITVREIVVLLEGGLRLTACTELPESCERAETCVMRLVWQVAAEAMHQKLEGYTLADLLKMEQSVGKGAVGQNVCKEV